MKFGSLKFSGLGAFITAAFHALLAILSGHYAFWLVAALLWAAIGFGLWREKSWLAWPGFFVASFGVAIGLSGIYGSHAWLYLIIAVNDFTIAASLFWNIWKRP